MKLTVSNEGIEILGHFNAVMLKRGNTGADIAISVEDDYYSETIELSREQTLLIAGWLQGAAVTRRSSDAP